MAWQPCTSLLSGWRWKSLVGSAARLNLKRTQSQTTQTSPAHDSNSRRVGVGVGRKCPVTTAEADTDRQDRRAEAFLNTEHTEQGPRTAHRAPMRAPSLKFRFRFRISKLKAPPEFPAIRSSQFLFAKSAARAPLLLLSCSLLLLFCLLSCFCSCCARC